MSILSKLCVGWVIAFAALLFSQASNALPDGKININTAAVHELAQGLKGVGRMRAQAILDYREQFGDFASVDALTEVSGIGSHVVVANQDRIVLADDAN